MTESIDDIERAETIEELRKRVQSLREQRHRTTPSKNSSESGEELPDPDPVSDTNGTGALSTIAPPQIATAVSLKTPTKSAKRSEPNTPSTIDETPPNSPQRVLVETKTTSSNESRRCFSFLGPFRTPVICALVIYGLVVTGFGGFLLQQFFRIPSLKNEIKDLTFQVDRLQAENERLM